MPCRHSRKAGGRSAPADSTHDNYLDDIANKCQQDMSNALLQLYSL